MNKLIGYIFSIAGLIVIAFSPQVVKWMPFLGNLGKMSILGIGIILVGIGIFFVMKDSSGRSGKIRQVQDEVPIYHGEGKHRKIVAYRKETRK